MDNVEVARRWIEGLNDESLPTLAVSHDDIEIGNVREFVVQGTYHGHDGVRQWLEEAFDVLADRRIEVVELIDGGDGETVVSVQRALGTSTHTDLPFDMPWAGVWKIRDGKVERVQGYASKRQALEAAGL